MTYQTVTATAPQWRRDLHYQVAVWFEKFSGPWWIAGGCAIDLFLGRETRLHADIDVGVSRIDVGNVIALLPAWEIFEAKEGRLTRISGEAPRADVTSLWCRPMGEHEWRFEILLDDFVDEEWVYRRDHRIRLPLTSLTRVSGSGIPYLAPEVQLLYKAKNPRPRDEADFEATVARLDRSGADWLVTALGLTMPSHHWIPRLQ